MSIPSHILDQLNSQADLVGIIGKHTTLKKAGREFKGNCPFHGEKTPSFYVNPQKNVYNCFGCGVSGNAISFLKDYENQTFMEAVRELSRQTGIEIPKEDNRKVQYKRSTPASNTNSSNNRNSNNRSNNSDSRQNPNNQNSSNQSSNHQNNAQNSAQNPETTNQPTQTANGTVTDNSNVGTLTPSPLDMPNGPVLDTGYYNDADMGSYYESESYFGNDGTPPVWDDGFAAADGAVPFVSDNASNNAQAQSQEGNLYELLISIGEFYQRNLHNNTQAMAYFKERGLTDATINEFMLGYAPAGWQHLEQAFPQDIEGLRALGLVRKSEKGRDYDLLRDRVIFPIRDNQGRIIGFAGRALDNEVKPKYINSSDSPVFHKQHVLYGYFESRQHRANDWVVVEGYMDVIALYQAGIYGAVASMGTSINETQIARLLQMNPTLTLCFDGDSAGQKAAWRTLEVALPVLSDDKELRFLTLPGGHDPDTYIAMQGVDAMREQIKRAMPLSQYIFAYLSERYDLSVAEGKAKLMSQVRQLTNNLPKGSSFKYLLNNDIYQKLGGRKNQKNSAHDVLLDFDSDMTIGRQLELCLLFSPNLLTEDPVERLWQVSGVAEIPIPPKLQQEINQKRLNAPTLPSWDDFNSPSLTALTRTIISLSPHLPKDTNAAAHFILANLPRQQQQILAQRWRPFWSNLDQRGIIDVDELVDDLLIQLMFQALSKQIADTKDLNMMTYLNRQRQTLSMWQKKHQAEQSAKIG